jgi:hypothetical protein
MTTVTVTDSFEHPVEKVWPIVSDFGGLHKYMRGMPEVRTEGSGLGQDRYIAMPQGEIVERLTWCDERTYSFSYTILGGPLPVTRYVATVKLSPEGNRCDIEWQGNFEPNGVSEDEARELVNGIYTGAIKGYKKALESA